MFTITKLEVAEMHEISRRTFLGGSAAILLLSGCTERPAPPANLRDFPVSITHHFGVTSIAARPKRVIAVGPASADICVALGVAPVMIPVSQVRDWRTTAWFDTALAELKVALPETYFDDELPIRKFARFAPDLILAVNSSINRNQYDQLSKLAPVVAYPDEPGNTAWRESTRMVATALGLEGAETIIARTEESISKAAAPFADFSALTGMFFDARGVSGAAFEVYGADTNPLRILGDYGIRDAVTLDNLEAEGTLSPTGTYELAPRDARLVSSDIFVAAVRARELAEIELNKTFDVFPGFREGRGIVLDFETDAYALFEASPLSVEAAATNLISEFARVNFVINGVR